MKHLIAILLSALVLFSCQKVETNGNAPKIPPVETMVIDFDQMTSSTKSATVANTNWIYSATMVGAWNLIIGTTFAIPVASFKASFNHAPTQIDDFTWQWTYTVDGFTNEYNARLLGKLESIRVKWEMHITKNGIDSFDEFLWFEGTSDLDGNSGQWILYHSAEFPEKTIQIDWKKEADEIGEVKYTYVRELNNLGETDSFKDSYLIYGIQDNTFDIYINIHAFNNESSSFNDTFIEWNRTDFIGHIKAEHLYGDNNWHCWDSQGNDIECN